MSEFYRNRYAALRNEWKRDLEQCAEARRYITRVWRAGLLDDETTWRVKTAMFDFLTECREKNNQRVRELDATLVAALSGNE